MYTASRRLVYWSVQCTKMELKKNIGHQENIAYEDSLIFGNL